MARKKKQAEAEVEVEHEVEVEVEVDQEGEVDHDHEVEVEAEREAEVEGRPEPAPARGRQPKYRRRKEARPEELVAAALELFADQGFAAARLRDVAKRAGVSKGTVYLYFKSKDALLRAAVRDSVLPILDVGDDLEVEAEGTAAELLRSILLGWMGEFDRRGVAGVPKLVMAEAGNFPELAQDYVSQVVQRSRRLFARIIKRGIRDGEFRDDIDVKDAVHVLMAPVMYAQIHLASLGSMDPGVFDGQRLVELHLDLFLRGIAAKETT